MLGALYAAAREHPAAFWGGTAVVLVLVLARLYQRRAAKIAEAMRQAEEAEEDAARRQADLAARQANLTARFGADIAGRLLRREIWEGQTADMLIEVCGQPADVDEKVMKKKTRRVYKYGPLGARRYALRVTLEDDVVVGWEGSHAVLTPQS